VNRSGVRIDDAFKMIKIWPLDSTTALQESLKTHAPHVLGSVETKAWSGVVVIKTLSAPSSTT